MPNQERWRDVKAAAMQRPTRSTSRGARSSAERQAEREATAAEAAAAAEEMAAKLVSARAAARAAISERFRYLGDRPVSPFHDAFLRRPPPPPPDMSPSAPEWSTFAHDATRGGAYSLIEALQAKTEEAAAEAVKETVASTWKQATTAFGAAEWSAADQACAAGGGAHEDEECDSDVDEEVERVNGEAETAARAAMRATAGDADEELLLELPVMMRERAYRVGMMPRPETMWSQPVRVHAKVMGEALGLDWSKYERRQVKERQLAEAQKEKARASARSDADDELPSPSTSRSCSPIPQTCSPVGIRRADASAAADSPPLRNFHASSAAAAAEARATPRSSRQSASEARATPLSCRSSLSSRTPRITPRTARSDRSFVSASSGGGRRSAINSARSALNSARSSSAPPRVGRGAVVTRDGRHVETIYRTEAEAALIERVVGHATRAPPTHTHSSVSQYSTEEGEVLLTPRS